MIGRRLEMAIEILTGHNQGDMLQFLRDVQSGGIDSAAEALGALYLDSPYYPEFAQVAEEEAEAAAVLADAEKRRPRAEHVKRYKAVAYLRSVGYGYFSTTGELVRLCRKSTGASK